MLVADCEDYSLNIMLLFTYYLVGSDRDPMNCAGS